MHVRLKLKVMVDCVVDHGWCFGWELKLTLEGPGRAVTSAVRVSCLLHLCRAADHPDP